LEINYKHEGRLKQSGGSGAIKKIEQKNGKTMEA
jgi:hypothetical protein